MLGEIPFVDNDDARFVRRDDGVGEALVDLAYRNRGIDQKQDDVRSVYGSRRSCVGVELDVVGDLVLLADACRVDGDKGSAVSFEAHVDAVTRRTRNFADDDALLPGECVDERALTGVALADQGDLHDRFDRFLVTNTGDPLGHEIDQLSSAVTVKGAHGNRLAESQAYELTDLRVEMGLVDLVGYKLNALAAPPQQVSRRAVQGRNALATVHYKKDQIGLIDGEANLSLDVFAKVIAVDDAVPAERLAAIIERHPLVVRSTLFDLFSGAGLTAGKRSVAYRLELQSSTGTLGAEELTEAVAAITEQLAKETGATLRA